MQCFFSQFKCTCCHFFVNLHIFNKIIAHYSAQYVKKAVLLHDRIYEGILTNTYPKPNKGKKRSGGKLCPNCFFKADVRDCVALPQVN